MYSYFENVADVTLLQITGYRLIVHVLYTEVTSSGSEVTANIRS